MKTQNQLKSIFTVLLLVLVGTSNLVYAASQKDFYGVWVTKDGKQFFEINKDAITMADIRYGYNNIAKYRIVKWEVNNNKNNNEYVIYTLSESNGKKSFFAKIDAYSDLFLDVNEMKKSSAAELNEAIKAIRDAEAAKAAEEAKVAKAITEAEAKRERVKKGSFTDARDNKIYRTVELDNQIWMAENLNYNAEGSKCYGNSESNCQKYGRLYNWSTAKAACPRGWHLPSDAEWQVLVDFAGGDEVAGKILKASSVNGVDVFGFSALPGGIGISGGGFFNAGDYGYWWSATESDASYAWRRYMSYSRAGVGRSNDDKANLFSVRCLQD
jgi:uncharacterized protein (TIGR02145 family)